MAPRNGLLNGVHHARRNYYSLVGVSKTRKLQFDKDFSLRHIGDVAKATTESYCCCEW